MAQLKRTNPGTDADWEQATEERSLRHAIKQTDGVADKLILAYFAMAGAVGLFWPIWLALYVILGLMCAGVF